MLYASMLEQAKGILEEEPWFVPALSNLSSLIMNTLSDLNWAGFYLMKNGRVPDVHQFAGHIACDGASESEIVIPIHADGQLKAVLDIDSPVKNRFSPEDRAGLERLAGLIEEKVNWA